MPSRRFAVLAAVLTLAAPASAAAQSAGDDQYQDPFAGDQEQSQGSGSQPAATATPAPGQSTATAPSSAPVPSGASPAAAAGAGELPRTGAPTLVVLTAGLVLLTAGLALRRRAARDNR